MFVCLCVNHLLVRAITRDPLKLGSSNLDHRCKRPWLRSLLFLDWSTLTFKVKFDLKVKIYPIWACPYNNSPPIQSRITKFGPEVQYTLVKIFFVLGGQLTLTFKVKYDFKIKFSGFTLPEKHNHHIATREQRIPRLFHGPDCFTVAILWMFSYT